MNPARLALAALPLAGLAVATPAHATPCAGTFDTVYACYIDIGIGFKGVLVSVAPAGTGVVAGTGCYYAGSTGNPRHYVSAYTPQTGELYLSVPVSGVPCF